MKAYRISGTAPFGSQRQPFSYDVTAEDNDAATHKVYSILGSRHTPCDGASRLRASMKLTRVHRTLRFSITSEKRLQHKAA